MDRVVKTTYPDDEVVTTTYNAQGLPLTLEGDALYVGSAAYNALGQVKELGFGSGVISTTHLYEGEETQDPGNDSFRLKQTRTFSDSTTHLQLGYTHDDVGNVASIIDVTKGNQLQTFTYDALDRLTGGSATGGNLPTYSRSYAYNEIGDLTGMGDVGYHYPDPGPGSVQPHAVRRVTGNGGTSKTIEIRARSTICNGGYADMELWVNGSQVQTWEDVASSWTIYTTSATLSGNDQIEVVFPNDCYNPPEDRNLYVDYVVVDGRTIQAEGGSAILDWGNGAASFDGLYILPGQEEILGNMALRFVVGSEARAACYDENGNMTCRQEDGLAYLQTWDAEKRLALVENLASDELTTFTYDGDGALVKRVANGETIVYAGIDHRRIQPLVTQKLLNGGHPAAGVHGAWSLPTGAGPLGIWRRRGSSSLPGTCGDHPIECRAFSFIPHPPTARP